MTGNEQSLLEKLILKMSDDISLIRESSAHIPNILKRLEKQEEEHTKLSKDVDWMKPKVESYESVVTKANKWMMISTAAWAFILTAVPSCIFFLSSNFGQSILRMMLND